MVINIEWTTEKLGRFDMADSLYSIMKEKNVDWTTNTADIVNYGHILLMRGKVPEAIHYYTMAEIVGINTSPQMKETEIKNIIRQSLTNDFYMFWWLGVGNPLYIDDASSKVGISKRKFYTSKADSSFTTSMHKKLIGTWGWSDSKDSVVIRVHPKIPMCQYRVFFNGQEKNRVLTNCRFSKNEGHTYWEELDQDAGIISSVEITTFSDEFFSVKIIENGNEQDRGRARKYHRIVNDE